MAQKFSNNARSSLSGSIVSGDLFLSVLSGDGTLFPSLGAGDFFLLTLVGYDAQGKENAWEIVKVTGVTTDTFTIERAQEGTTAQNWSSGTRVENRFTAGAAASFAVLTGLNTANWNMAYGWGNHASASYLPDGGTSVARILFDAGLRVNDNDTIEFGTGIDAKLSFNGTNLLLDLIAGDWQIRDNTTVRATFHRTKGRFKANAFVPGLKSVNAGATTTFDLTNGTNYTVTLNQTTNFAFTTDANSYGMSGTLIVRQDSTGGHTFSLPAAAKTPVGGAAINQNTSPDTLNILTYFVVDANTILVNYVGDFA